MDDLGGWEPTGRERDLLLRLLDALEKRIDALRADVNVLMGREVPHDEEERERITIFGWGLSNWTALLTAVATVLGAIAVILGKGS